MVNTLSSGAVAVEPDDLLDFVLPATVLPLEREDDMPAGLPAGDLLMLVAPV